MRSPETSRSDPMRRADAIVCATAVLTLVAALAVLIVGDLDLGQTRDVAHDVVFRSDDGIALRPPRFYDPSPFSIWLSSDAFVWKSIRDLEPPFWQRVQGGGSSPVAQFYNGVFHPIRWIVAVVPLAQYGSALSLVAWWSGGLGLYLLCRLTLRWSLVSSLCTAAILMLSGNTLSLLFFSGAILALVHAPWILLAWFRWRHRRHPAWWAVLVVAMGLTFLAGHPAMVMTCFLIAGLVIALDLATATHRLSWTWSFVSAGLVACGVAAIGIVPSLFVLDELWSYKNSTEVGRSFQVFPWSEWSAAVQSVFVDRSSSRTQLDTGDFYNYLGPGTALMALAGFVLACRRRGLRWIALITFVGLLIAYPNPLTAPLRHLPVLAYWKTWYLLWVFTFGAALCAGAFVEWARSVVAPSRKAFVAISLTVLAVAPLWLHLSQHRILWPVLPLESSILTAALGQSDDPRATGLFGQTHMPNISEVTQLEDLRFSSPVHTWRYKRLLSVVSPAADDLSFPTTPVPTQFDSDYLHRFDVKLVFVSRLRNQLMSTEVPNYSAEGFRFQEIPPSLAGGLVGQTEAVALYRIPDAPAAPSRARFAARAVHAPNREEAFQLMLRYRQDADPPDVVEGDVPDAAIGSAAEVISVSYPSSRSVEIEYVAPTSALIVLADSYARGWTAAVEGSEVSLIPVNLNSRGAVVPGGRRRLVMSYTPPGMLLGTTLTIGSLVLVLTFVVWQRRKRTDLTREARSTESGANGEQTVL